MRSSASMHATKLIAVFAAVMYAWIALATGPAGCTEFRDAGSVVCMHARLCHEIVLETHDTAAAVKSCCRKSASRRREGVPTVGITPESCSCCVKAPGSPVVARAMESSFERTRVWEPVAESPFLMLVDGDLSMLNRLVHGRPPPDPRGDVTSRVRRDCSGLLSSRLVI